MSNEVKQKDVAEMDPIQLRRKFLQSGKEKLVQKDFGTDTKTWESYQKDIKNAESIKGVPIEQMLKGLHSGKSEYGKFLPGGGVKRTVSAVSKIPELNRLNEICNKAHKAFEDWTAAEGKAVLENVDKVIRDLGYKDDLPVFTSYFNGLNPVKKFVKETYGEEE